MWWALALVYGVVWAVVVPGLAWLARRLEEEQRDYA